LALTRSTGPLAIGPGLEAAQRTTSAPDFTAPWHVSVQFALLNVKLQLAWPMQDGRDAHAPPLLHVVALPHALDP
jgi:hypothetical protein